METDANNKIQGILISMIKRMPYCTEKGNTSFDYTIIGSYYDGMNIKEIRSWMEYSPVSLNRANNEPTIDDGIFNIYSVRAIAPNKAMMAELEKEGFRYDIWDKDKKSPMVACTLIHLTNGTVENIDINRNIRQLADKIVEISRKNETKFNMESVNCSIYFSLGYSDIILLFQFEDLSCVKRILEELNGFTFQPTIPDAGKRKDKNGQMHVISDSYTIIGAEDSEIESLRKMAASISEGTGKCEPFLAPFSLKPDISKKNTSQSNGHLYDQKIENYQTCMEQFKCFAEQYGISTRNHDAIMQLLKTFRNLISVCHGFEIDFIITNVLDSFFQNLEIEMRETNRIKGEMKPDLEKQSAYEKEQALVKKINDILEVIKKFREHIGTYLNDLLRSRQSLLEGRIMEHSSIVSLTKLLFAYNGFVNELTHKITDPAVDGEKSIGVGSKNTYNACIVVSGGCDNTRVDEIFSHRGLDGTESGKLFVVSVPEITLFDIKGTLIRLGHECFHVYGNRRREVRLQEAVYAVHAYMADSLANYFFSDEVLLLDKDKKFKGIKGSQEWKTFKNEIKKHFYKRFFECVEQLDQQDIKDYCEEIRNENTGYLDISKQWIKEIIGRDYSIQKSYIRCGEDTTEHLRTFFGYMCVLILYEIKKIYIFILGKDDFHDREREAAYESELASINYYLKDEYKYLEEDDTYINDYRLYTDFCKVEYGHVDLIRRYFMKFKMPEELYALAELEKKEKNDKDDKDKLKENIKDLKIYRYEEMISIILEAMCECYADGMALKTLGMCKKETDTAEQVEKKAAKFLSNFFYENRDYRRALPISMGGVYRIGVVLNAAYGIDKNSYDSRRAGIENGLRQAMSDYNMKYEENMMERLDGIINDYNEYRIGQHIEEYVKKCLKDTRELMEEKYELIPEISSMTNDGIYNFLEHWRELKVKE